jgi:hypothetical protein
MLLTSGELSYKEFGKFLLTTALDIAEKMILISIAQIFAKEIADKSFAGIATAAILTGLVKGAFAGIKSQVQNFAEGTEYVHGPGTETSDSIPAMLSKGERVIPANINKKLLGISNDKLTEVINVNSRNENIKGVLHSILEQTARTSDYVAKGQNTWVQDGYLIMQDWQSGTIRKIKIQS